MRLVSARRLLRRREERDQVWSIGCLGQARIAYGGVNYALHLTDTIAAPSLGLLSYIHKRVAELTRANLCRQDSFGMEYQRLTC